MSIRVGVIGVGIKGADHASTLPRVISGATVSAVTDFDTRADPHRLSKTGGVSPRPTACSHRAWIDSLADNHPSPLATAEDGLAATVAATLIKSTNDHGAPIAVKQP